MTALLNLDEWKTFICRKVRHMNLPCAWKLGHVHWYCLLPETFYTSINWAYWKTRTWDPLETLAGPCNIQKTRTQDPSRTLAGPYKKPENRDLDPSRTLARP